MHSRFGLFVCGLALAGTVFSASAQTKAKGADEGMTNPNELERYSWPIVSVGAGATFYTGGIHSPRNLSKFSGTRWGVNAQVEQRFGKYFGGKFNLFYGLTAGERHTMTEFDNFQARLTSADVRFAFHLDHIIGKRQLVAPYVAVGIGYINFRSKSDLTDANGNTYFLWNDGSLRDQAQTGGQTNGTPQELKRDFTYETTVNKSSHTVTFPIEAGIRFKVHDYWDFGMGYTYTFLLNRFVPSVANTKPDNYGYASATIYWYLGQFNQ